MFGKSKAEIKDTDSAYVKSRVEGYMPFAVVDVRTREEYEKGHIPEAIQMAFDDLKKEAKKSFKTDEEIIVYSSTEADARKAAEQLKQLGFKDIKVFALGLQGWKEAGNGLKAGFF